MERQDAHESTKSVFAKPSANTGPLSAKGILLLHSPRRWHKLALFVCLPPPKGLPDSIVPIQQHGVQGQVLPVALNQISLHSCFAYSPAPMKCSDTYGSSPTTQLS